MVGSLAQGTTGTAMPARMPAVQSTATRAEVLVPCGNGERLESLSYSYVPFPNLCEAQQEEIGI